MFILESCRTYRSFDGNPSYLGCDINGEYGKLESPGLGIDDNIMELIEIIEKI